MELPYEVRLPVEAYARVLGTSSPSRASLLHFPMRTKALFDDIQSYSVLDSSTKQ